jgi:hypothetical protein
MSNLDHIQVWCVMCRGEIPDDRKRRRSNTCSQDCASKRNKYLRARTDARKCRFCGQPCTEEEKASYRAWRKWLREQAKVVVK